MVNQSGETMNGLADCAYPIGTQLYYLDSRIRSISSVAMGDCRTKEPYIDTPVMREGTLVGYDFLGGATHLMVQRNNEAGEPEGVPRIINTKCLASFAEIVEVMPGSETIDTRDHVLPTDGEHFIYA